VAEAWTHHDLTVIAVMSVGTSNGEIVDGQLEQLSDPFGTPLGKLSDRGSDLKKTSKCFSGGHSNTESSYLFAQRNDAREQEARRASRSVAGASKSQPVATRQIIHSFPCGLLI